MFFCFEALYFHGPVEPWAAERAPAGGRRIIRHVLAWVSLRVPSVVAFAVLEADGFTAELSHLRTRTRSGDETDKQHRLL